MTTQTVKITQEDGVWIHSSSKKIDGNHIGVAEFETTFTFLNEVVANDITWWEIDFSPDLPDGSLRWMTTNPKTLKRKKMDRVHSRFIPCQL
jgi:hypothetical protein